MQNMGIEVYTSQSEVEFRLREKYGHTKLFKSCFLKLSPDPQLGTVSNGKATAWNVKEKKQRVSGGPFFPEEPEGSESGSGLVSNPKDPGSRCCPWLSLKLISQVLHYQKVPCPCCDATGGGGGRSSRKLIPLSKSA